jgi:hypothetical protein
VTEYLRLVRFYSLAILGLSTLVMMAASFDIRLGAIVPAAILVPIAVIQVWSKGRNLLLGDARKPVVAVAPTQASAGVSTSSLSPGSATFLRLTHDLLMEHERRLNSIIELRNQSNGWTGALIN